MSRPIFRTDQHTEKVVIPGELNNGDKMPFGRFKGERMDEVPFHWYQWLWLNMAHDTNNMVIRYIEKNLHIMETSEDDKGNWRGTIAGERRQSKFL